MFAGIGQLMGNADCMALLMFNAITVGWIALSFGLGLQQRHHPVASLF